MTTCGDLRNLLAAPPGLPCLPHPFKRDRNIVPGTKVCGIDFYGIRITFKCQGIVPFLEDGISHGDPLRCIAGSRLEKWVDEEGFHPVKGIEGQPVRAMQVRDKDEQVVIHRWHMKDSSLKPYSLVLNIVTGFVRMSKARFPLKI